jgi:flagellar biosynthesis/type III secretory pathway protein FliH
MSSSPNSFQKLTTLRDFSPQAVAEDAAKRIQAIKSQFETEFMPKVHEAKAEGLAEGKKLGEEAARAALQPVLNTLQQTLIACEAAKNEHLARLEALTLELLALYLPQLVGSLAAQAPAALMKDTLHKVMQKVDSAHQPTLYVAAEVESMTRQLCQEKPFSDTLGKLIIKADSHLKPGDCRMDWRNHGQEINLGLLLQEVVNELQAQAAAVAPVAKLEQQA